jgi:hypothetical protein
LDEEDLVLGVQDVARQGGDEDLVLGVQDVAVQALGDEANPQTQLFSSCAVCLLPSLTVDAESL